MKTSLGRAGITRTGGGGTGVMTTLPWGGPTSTSQPQRPIVKRSVKTLPRTRFILNLPFFESLDQYSRKPAFDNFATVSCQVKLVIFTVRSTQLTQILESKPKRGMCVLPEFRCFISILQPLLFVA